MPSKKNVVFEAVEKNFAQAAANYYRDMVACTTEEQAQAIDQNYKEAETAWAKAMIAAMEQTGDAVEAALAELKAANKEIEKARSASKKIDDLIKLLKQATAVAGFIVKIAAL